VASGVSELFLLFTFHKMSKEEVATAAYDRASTALAETRAELKEAKRVVAEWDEATPMVKRKTIEQWKQEVADLKEKEKDAKQEVKEARAAFMAVVSQGILF
jgi:hypothetical protein